MTSAQARYNVDDDYIVIIYHMHMYDAACA